MSVTILDAWKSVPSNPDPETDLGYASEPLTQVHVADENEHYIFLPAGKDHLSDEEFMIASPESVCDLQDRR